MMRKGKMKAPAKQISNVIVVVVIVVVVDVNSLKNLSKSTQKL